MKDNDYFISKSLNNMLPPIFKNLFKFCYSFHHYNSSSSEKGHLHKKILELIILEDFLSP